MGKVRILGKRSAGFYPILPWAGRISTIPAGWRLCDGTNGTPDLSDRFVLGAQNNSQIGQLGGSNLVSQSHAHHNAYSPGIVELSGGAEAGHTHPILWLSNDYMESAAWQGALVGVPVLGALQHHKHEDSALFRILITDTSAHHHVLRGPDPLTPGSGLTDQGTVSTDIRPPFYALAYILSETPDNLPLHSVGMTAGTVETLPPGYVACDGSYNGAPNLSGACIVGASGDFILGTMYGSGTLQSGRHTHGGGSYAAAGGEHTHTAQNVRSGAYPGTTALPGLETFDLLNEIKDHEHRFEQIDWPADGSAHSHDWATSPGTLEPDYAYQALAYPLEPKSYRLLYVYRLY